MAVITPSRTPNTESSNRSALADLCPSSIVPAPRRGAGASTARGGASPDILAPNGPFG
jgi:hypothetical protein